MADAVADSSERLPWLSNAAPARRPPLQPRQPRRSWLPLLIAVSAVAAIAFGGSALVERGSAPEPVERMEQGETVTLPPAATSPPDSEPQSPSAAERDALRPVAAEPITASPLANPSARTSSKPSRGASPKRRATAQAAAGAPAYDPRAWRSGVPGRIIQLGAFGTSAKAQSEWRRVYARYPLLRPLSPRVIRSKIRGRTYHRLQLGTFSQAHSELLCQRLRATGQDCIVLGLPVRGRG